MARKKTKSEAIEDVWKWLLSEFPVRRETRLVIKDLGPDDLGYVLEDDAEILVSIDARMPLYAMIDTMLHEWAHVKSRRTEHGTSFVTKYVQIEKAYWKWKKNSTQ